MQTSEIAKRKPSIIYNNMIHLKPHTHTLKVMPWHTSKSSVTRFHLFMHACMHFVKGTTSDTLVQVNDCYCPGDEVAYECTVCGEGATVWSGSLFDCANDEIILRHGKFDNGTTAGECNNGAVTAHSIGVLDTYINNSRCFLSLLNVSMNTDANNKTVMCLHVNGVNEVVVNTLTASFTTGKAKLINFTFRPERLWQL